MAKGLCPPFDAQAYREGHLTPVYFGSALNNFGVRELLAGVGELAPAPRPQPADPRPISPEEPKVAGFVFKEAVCAEVVGGAGTADHLSRLLVQLEQPALAREPDVPVAVLAGAAGPPAAGPPPRCSRRWG